MILEQFVVHNQLKIFFIIVHHQLMQTLDLMLQADDCLMETLELVAGT